MPGEKGFVPISEFSPHELETTPLPLTQNHGRLSAAEGHLLVEREPVDPGGDLEDESLLVEVNLQRHLLGDVLGHVVQQRPLVQVQLPRPPGTPRTSSRCRPGPWQVWLTGLFA